MTSPPSLGELPAFPPLASLFVTHFDDIKGQSVAYYVSLDGESDFVAPFMSIPNPNLMLRPPPDSHPLSLLLTRGQT